MFYNRQFLPNFASPMLPAAQVNPMAPIMAPQIPMQAPQQSKGLFDNLGGMGGMGLLSMLGQKKPGIDQNAPGIKNTILSDPMDPMSQFLPMDQQMMVGGNGMDVMGLLRGLFG